jgi:hypothetical protein
MLVNVSHVMQVLFAVLHFFSDLCYNCFAEIPEARQLVVEPSCAEGTFVMASTKNNDCVEIPAFSNAFVKTPNGLFRRI